MLRTQCRTQSCKRMIKRDKRDIPVEFRRLRAAMELRGLRLVDVSARSGVSYGVASAVLTGRLFHPTALEKLRTAIYSVPEPQLEPA